MGKTAERALAMARVNAQLLGGLAQTIQKLSRTVTLMGERIDALTVRCDCLTREAKKDDDRIDAITVRVDALEEDATPTPSVDHTDAPDGYYAVASNGECEGCAFDMPGGCGVGEYFKFPCCESERKDRRDVIFRRIEEEGGE